MRSPRRKDGARDNIWVRIKHDKNEIAQLTNDLTALYISRTIRRTPSGGRGPTGLALSPDEKTLYVANYYAGTVGVLSATEGKLLGTIAVGHQPEARRRPTRRNLLPRRHPLLPTLAQLRLVPSRRRAR